MGEFAVIGRPRPRPDAAARATGRTRYAGDLTLPGQLWCRLVRSPLPHARLARIDTAAARALPGVAAVLTGRDLPTRYGILPVSQDEEVLCSEKVRYVGDPVAAVAAVDEETAAQAAALVQVDYVPLPAVFSVDDALRPEEEPIHPSGNLQRAVALEFGDVEEGFQVAAYVREDLFFYDGSTHLPLEEHAVLASYTPEGTLTVWSSTQTPHYLHRALSRVLQMPMERIRVIAAPVGGGFGGKSDVLNHEIAAAALSRVTGRPVKCVLTREEVFYAHRGRHPTVLWVRSGWTADGRITALHLRTWLDGGAYGSYGVATTYYSGALAPLTYRIPHYRFEGMRVFTNKPACGPKRGHGTPQPRFALECHLDKVAQELGLDPVDLRRRNLVAPFSTTVNWLRVTSCGLERCIDEVVGASGFLGKHRRLPRGRGVGFAVSGYLSGAGLPVYWNDLPHSQVHLAADRSGRVTLFSGAADIGQGSDAILVATAAEILGLSPEEILLVAGDTALTPIDLGSYSSRVTFMAGNAALQAAQRLRALVARGAAARLEAAAEDLVFAKRRVFVRGSPDRGLSWPEACAAAEATCGPLQASGAYTPPRLAGPYKGSGVGPSPAYSFSACVAQVAVDEETGEVRVEKVWLAHDIGRALNPLLVRGQIEGSVYMAVGEALLERQDYRGGAHRGPSMLDYKSPTVYEMPEVEAILVESVDPEGPFGAKECGQGPLLPVVPAIANAIYDAVGVRVDEVPVTPDMLLRALDRQRRGEDARVGPKVQPPASFGPLTRVRRPEGWA